MRYFATACNGWTHGTPGRAPALQSASRGFPHMAGRLGIRNWRARVARLIVVLCVVVAAGSAQDPAGKKPAQPEIRGAVIEDGVLQPVANVEVSLIRLPTEGPRIISAAIPRDVIQTTKTGATGTFVFKIDKLGDYRVEIQKEGFRPAPSSSTSISVTLNDEHPDSEIKFVLVRPAELSGRVVDDETDKPVPMLRVFVAQRRYLCGRATNLGGATGSATTDAEGRFVVAGLQPGGYVLRLGSRMYTQGAAQAFPEAAKYGVARLLTEFSDDDLKAVTWDYEQTWWPGGGDLQTASPIPLPSGATINVGKVPAKKRRVYSVRVSVVASTCTANTAIQVDVTGSSLGTGVGRVPCGKDFLMRGYPPGSYRLEAVVDGGNRNTRERGSVPFDILDENIKLSVPVIRGVDVDGKIVLAEGARAPDLKKLDLRLVGWVNNADEVSNKVDGQGRFRIVNVAIRDQQLYISGLATPHYVKEVRYNGSPVPDNIVPMDGRAPSHLLEIVVDDKPAAIMGTVTRSDRPVSQPHVVLMKWPLSANDPYLFGMRTASGDKDGKFQLVGLPPGEYRLFAVDAADQVRLDEPGVLDRLLGNAQKITLPERGFQNLKLELTEIR